MSERIAALVGVQALLWALGIGLLPVLRLATTWRELVRRLPLGYPVGLAAGGILAADLAVVDVPVGGIVLPILGVLSLVVGLRRLPAGTRSPRRWPRPSELASFALLGVIAVFGGLAARVFAIKPLIEIDGWSIWGLRARALYDFGHPIAPVFTDPAASYQALQHPLLLPALEATDSRFMHAWDPTLIHLQVFGFGVAFVVGGWYLLRRQAPPLLVSSVLLAAVLTSTFYDQLQSNLADMPLAILVALGVVALATWLRSGTTGMLPAAALFLGAAALTKNEGEVFALAAFLAAGLVAWRTRRLGLLLRAAAFVVAVDLPWRIWLWWNNVHIAEYSLANLYNPTYLWDNRGRVWPSIRELWAQMSSFGAFGYIGILIIIGVVGALAIRQFRVATFAGLWLTLSFAGLIAIYWISTNTLGSNLDNSSDRTIDSLMYGGALLVPVLLGGAARSDLGPVPGDGGVAVEDAADVNGLVGQPA